jgi:hypothetical protein
MAEWIAFLFHSQKISHPNVGLETPHPSWRLQSAGIRQSLDSYIGTDVLEELAASIFRVVYITSGGSKPPPQNVVTFQ